MMKRATPYLITCWVLIFLMWAMMPASAAVGFVYFDTGGCESASTTKCSGSTDSASASAKGAGSTVTCGAASGPGATPGCIITGTNAAAGQLGSIATDGSQSLFMNCATNSNQKIFWINTVDNGTGAVGTTVTPTGCTAATSDWGIGGRMIYTSANFESGIRAGDTMIFNNTPASKSAAFLTPRLSGDATTGFITVKGKAGTRPVLATSNASAIFNSTGTQNLWYVQNLELQRGGASANVVNVASGTGWVLDNVKISLCATAGAGASFGATATVINSEITGCGGDGIIMTATTQLVAQGNYIHGNTGNGITFSATDPAGVVDHNIISGNTGKGVYLSGASTTSARAVVITNNTIYNNTDSGLEVAAAATVVQMRNNIFQSSGTPFNVKWALGNAQLVSAHNYNVFYISAGSNNLSGLTTNSTEVTTNPNLTNPGSADFSINSASSAANLGYPGQLLGANLSYLDAGAAQRNASTAGGGGQVFGQ